MRNGSMLSSRSEGRVDIALFHKFVKLALKLGFDSFVKPVNRNVT